MSRELLSLLFETTVATSAAIVLVLVLRRPLRRAFGARAAYALWWLVPVAGVAVMLPAPVSRLATAQAVVMPQALQPLAQDGGIGLQWPWVVLAPWMAGALAMAAAQGWQQWRFLQRLGPLRTRSRHMVQAATSAGLPAVMGVLRPRIVLPADFLQRYDAAERALIVRHERLHIVRGDLQCNAAAALLRCVYWFNPVLHVGLRCYRHDQELACDARVLADHPASRRRYGQAMLKTQLDASPLPVGCHWHTHPIKERIAMLKHPAPRRWQKILSMLLLPVVLCGGGYAAWAKQPASAGPQAGAAMEASSALATNQAPGPSAGRADVFQGNVRLDMPPRGREPVDVARLPPASQGATAQRTPAPAYPREAAKRQVQGRVVVLVDVAPDGSVSGATVETSEPAGVFDAVTLAAVRTWTFRPARQNGVPVAGRVRVPVDFSLGKPAKDAARPPRLTGWFSESLHDDPARPELASLQCDRLVVHHDADGAPSQTECGIDAR